MILETREEVRAVGRSVPCGEYWIGGSTNIELEYSEDFTATNFDYDEYIPNDSGIILNLKSQLCLCISYHYKKISRSVRITHAGSLR